jgi:putative (di)nucleoside polyphosphate hydrolase
MIKTYRKCVAAIILNNDGLIFFAKRIDVDDAWQCPQGGIDDGEGEEEALLRELFEEIGTNDVTILKKTKTLLQYDLPHDIFEKMKMQWENPYAGQKQRWFLCKLNETAKINLNTHHQEFDAYKWVTTEEAINLIVDFKRDVFKQVIKEFFI